MQLRGMTAEELLVGSEDGVCSRVALEGDEALQQLQAVKVHPEVHGSPHVVSSALKESWRCMSSAERESW